MYRTPGRGPVTETFGNVEDFRKSFQGWRFRNTKTNISRYSGQLPDDMIDPSVVYDADHPLLLPRKAEVTHQQVADKVFEEKSIKSLERHLLLRTNIKRWVAHDPARKDGWRFLTDKTNMAEWEGVWQGPDGHVYFLEVKHHMSRSTLMDINTKLLKSLRFVGIPPSMATVYVAGKYWDHHQALATSYGFGLMEENGVDLSIEDPREVEEAAKKGTTARKKESTTAGKKKGGLGLKGKEPLE